MRKTPKNREKLEYDASKAKLARRIGNFLRTLDKANKNASKSTPKFDSGVVAAYGEKHGKTGHSCNISGT
jgi:hypothetical protein